MRLATKIIARIIFLPLLLAAGLAVTALVTLRVMFTPSDLEAIVTNQFQELLKRPVQLDSARLSLTGEIQVRGLRVVEPGPEAVDLLKADYIYATYRVAPLLKRQLQIDSIVLVGPQIELFRRADGTWNISDILASYRAAPRGGMLGKIDSAEVKDGRISITELPSRRRHSFENFNAALSNFKPDADTPFHASVFLKSDAFRKPVEGRLYTEGAINFAGFHWDEAEVKGLRADLAVQDKSLSFAGSIRNFRRPEITLRAETPAMKSGDLAYFFSAPPFNFTVPRASWDVSTVFLSTSSAELRVTAKPLNLRCEGSFDLSRSTPSYAFTVSAPPLALDLLRRYGVVLPVEDLSGTADLRVRLSSAGGRLSVPRLFLNTAKAGFKYRNLSASGLNMASLLSDDFSSNFFNVTGGRLALSSNRMDALKLKAELSRKEMLFNYSGDFNGTFAKGRIVVMKPFTPERTLELTGYSKRAVYSEIKDLVFGIKDMRGPRVGMPEVKASMPWLKTLKNSIPMGYSSVKLLYRTDLFRHEYIQAADFYASASLKDIAGDIAKIRGDVSFKAGAGTFFDVQKTSEKDRVFYIFSLPLTFIHRMNRTGALKFGYKVKDISFNSIGGDYYAENGKVQIKNFYIDGKEFSAYVSGQLDFFNETMDVKIYTIYSKYYSMGSLPEALTDSSGKPALAFTLKGKMASPEFEMVSPADSGDRIREAALKGAQIDFARIDGFAGGKK